MTLPEYQRRLVDAIIADAREALAGRQTTRRADAVRAEWDRKISEQVGELARLALNPKPPTGEA